MSGGDWVRIIPILLLWGSTALLFQNCGNAFQANDSFSEQSNDSLAEQFDLDSNLVNLVSPDIDSTENNQIPEVIVEGSAGTVPPSEVDVLAPNLIYNNFKEKLSTTQCTIYVSNSGQNKLDNGSENSPFKTIQYSVLKANPGDTVCIKGNQGYLGLKISDKHGKEDSPITIKSWPGTGQAIINQGGIGISFNNSSYIHILDLKIEGRSKGISLTSSDYFVIKDNFIMNSGTAHISVGREIDWITNPSNPIWARPNDPAIDDSSSFIDIVGNRMVSSGMLNRTYEVTNPQTQVKENIDGASSLGEGIYVGTGAKPSLEAYVKMAPPNADRTHHVYIIGNLFEDVTSEAVDIKAFTTDIKIRGNFIKSGKMKFGGSITVGEARYNYGNGNYRIEDNVISNLERPTNPYTNKNLPKHYPFSGILVSHGKTTIKNNIIYNIDGGRGILLNNNFASENGEGNDVYLLNNTIYTPSSNFFENEESLRINYGYGGLPVEQIIAEGDLQADIKQNINNVTDDGSTNTTEVVSSFFVGPLEGDNVLPSSLLLQNNDGNKGANWIKIKSIFDRMPWSSEIFK